MSDNSISYNRFTALPPNISAYGSTVEEFQLQKGKPDPNPVLSPMPQTRVAEARLALGGNGSDKLRLANPTQPEANPYEGPKTTLSLSRSAIKKLSSNVVGELENLIKGGVGIDASLRPLMEDSLRRVGGLCDYMGYLNKMTEAVYVRSIAASKG